MSTPDTTQEGTRKRQLSGTVVRKSGAKTVSVEIVRVVAHPLYGKRMNRTSRYLAHDESNEITVGDAVLIEESRPLSKRKRWVVIKKTV
ncbi:MAG: 30S ribosomal protein S17 [Candidatus Andersenbacteria bacterium]|nr:30S ribosomal protein S17 [Candidatus Andersenbacteria bacterium]